MKNLFAFIFAVVACLQLQAQAPQRFSYQAVVRDGSNTLVTNSTVGMRVSLLQGNASGPTVYVETHSPTTNTNGLVSLAVGGGTVISGSMANIDWIDGPYFIRTEADPDGGTNYSIDGVSQLLSVPYALHAANNQPGPAGPQGPPGPPGTPGTSDCQTILTNLGRVVVYTSSTAHGFGPSSTVDNNSLWYSIAIDGEVLGSIANDTAAVIYTSTTAYAFTPNAVGSGWQEISLNGSPVGALASSGRIVVYTSSEAYGLGRNSSLNMSWFPQVLDGPVIEHFAAGNRIVLLTNNTAYGFHRLPTGGGGQTSNWRLSELPSPPLVGRGTR
jgi:hypothetical protein